MSERLRTNQNEVFQAPLPEEAPDTGLRFGGRTLEEMQAEHRDLHGPVQEQLTLQGVAPEEDTGLRFGGRTLEQMRAEIDARDSK